ncbi:MAG: hypothetical protein ACN2B6_12300 [Rickettsiales bacterium]
MKIPKHILENSKCETQREWKGKKRKQAREVKKSLNELMLGCAYFPNGTHDVDAAIIAIERVIEDISIENFGR